MKTATIAPPFSCPTFCVSKPATDQRCRDEGATMALPQPVARARA
jgi:hypothetical protein